jgi:hypothetical protein
MKTRTRIFVQRKLGIVKNNLLSSRSTGWLEALALVLLFALILILIWLFVT